MNVMPVSENVLAGWNADANIPRDLPRAPSTKDSLQQVVLGGFIVR